jgi:hypothetical protein
MISVLRINVQIIKQMSSWLLHFFNNHSINPYIKGIILMPKPIKLGKEMGAFSK